MRIQKVLSTLTTFFVFLVDQGREDQNITKSEGQRYNIKWRFAGGPMMANFECWLGFSGDSDQY